MVGQESDRNYLWLRAMIDQLPNKRLAVFERAAKDGFGVSGEVESLASVRSDLD